MHSIPTPYIVANWKLNGSKQLASDMLSALKNIPADRANIIVCPPYPYLSCFQGKAQQAGLYYGAQNCAPYVSGAYTGEVSVAMLVDMGCQYVIIGHSERRQYAGETDQVIAAKVSLALESGLTPILCVGETENEHASKLTLAVLRKQIVSVIDRQSLESENLASRLIIAYEPVWAIGTGRAASPECAQERHHEIRTLLSAYDADFAAATPILYGGSVKADNVSALARLPDINGFLVGGASLDPQQFLNICEETITHYGFLEPGTK